VTAKYRITDADVAALDDMPEPDVQAAGADIVATALRHGKGSPAQAFTLLLATLQVFIEDTDRPIDLTKVALEDLNEALVAHERMRDRIERAIARGKANPS